MAKARTNTKAKTTDVKREDVNEVTFSGIVKRVNYSGEKMASYNVDCHMVTPKGNTAHVWVDVIDFNRTMDLEEGDSVYITGELMTQCYDGKNGKVYKVVIKANTLDTSDVPFN